MDCELPRGDQNKSNQLYQSQSPNYSPQIQLVGLKFLVFKVSLCTMTPVKFKVTNLRSKRPISRLRASLFLIKFIYFESICIASQFKLHHLSIHLMTLLERHQHFILENPGIFDHVVMGAQFPWIRGG
ncbi:hypothetical protein ABFS82_13G050900 [Erythranthe guttata]